MTDKTPEDLHKPNYNERSDDDNTASIHAYYNEKFNRLSDRTKSALKIIELECETIRELLKTYEDTSPNNNGS